MDTSVYHLFVHLAERRGYFAQFENLEQFDFPDDLIVARSESTFPDLVLKHNPDSMPSGGEFIELKTSKSYSIASFNSTLPSATKRVGSLSQKIRDQMRSAGEEFDEEAERRVYYLIVGRNIKAKPAPLTKVCLVSGRFFETMPTRDLLLSAATLALGQEVDQVSPSFRHESAEEIQARFAQSRNIDGASVKVRFRVMAEVSPEANLLNSRRFPLIADDSISFIEPLSEGTPSNQKGRSLVNWSDADRDIRDTPQCMDLANAIDDVNPDLKRDIELGRLVHPSGGAYLLAQMDLRGKNSRSN